MKNHPQAIFNILFRFTKFIQKINCRAKFILSRQLFFYSFKSSNLFIVV